jgi:hypothetical protein
VRLAALSCAFLGALALAGSAFGAYTPRLVVTSATYALGGGESHTLQIRVAQTDEATSKLSIYVPQGYSATITQPPGTTLGSVRGSIFVTDAGASFPVEGIVRAESPASTSLRADAARCTGTPDHEAIWVFFLGAATTQLQIPVFVDRIVAGVETPFGSLKLQLCLPAPDTPQGTPGRAPFGVKLVEASLTLRGVLTNPTVPGEFAWRLHALPYIPGTGVPNLPGAVESRSLVRLPMALSLQAKFDKRRGVVTLSGRAVEGGQPIPGLQVDLLTGPSAARVTKRVATVRANRRGSYKKTLRLRRTAYFRVRVRAGLARDVTASKCGGPFAPGPPPATRCVSATMPPLPSISSTSVRVVGRR